jgi:hypothetical protein
MKKQPEINPVTRMVAAVGYLSKKHKPLTRRKAEKVIKRGRL